MVESARREMRTESGAGDQPALLRRPRAEVSFPPSQTAVLERMAGPSSYEGVALPDDALHLGAAADAPITLEQAVRSAVQRNLSIQSASITPAVRAAEVVAAEARFDWTFFTSVDYARTDEPSAVPVIGGFPVGSSLNKNQSVGFETGVRRNLESGATLQIAQGLTYTDQQTPGIAFNPDPANAAFIDIAATQPLLRGFGSDVTQQEIRLARNVERDAVQTLQAEVMRVVTATERAYWNLVAARRGVLIAKRLLDRGIETRDVLKARQVFDVKPAEYSDAVARVEQRRAALLRAQNAMRKASDALKVLINDPATPVGGEAILVPTDAPLDEAIEISLIDAVASAIDKRPEVRRAILTVDSASIRQIAADANTLPLLDLGFRTRFGGLSDTPGRAYGQITDADFVNYVLDLRFETPIGNRGPEAAARARRLDRLRAVVDYRSAVQQAVLNVKTSLRDVATNYQLIEQTRSSRLAASENLRTLQVEEQTLRALTPDFLDLKLRRQEALAQAEIDEIQALVDYNNALADMHNAMGTALTRNKIDFVVPPAGDAQRPLQP